MPLLLFIIFDVQNILQLNEKSKSNKIIIFGNPKSIPIYKKKHHSSLSINVKLAVWVLFLTVTFHLKNKLQKVAQSCFYQPRSISKIWVFSLST